MTDNIALRRADALQIREALASGKRLYAALTALDAALAEPPAIAELFAQFAAKQRPLDADMAAIINANLDSLYITDEPATALAEPEQKPEPATDAEMSAAMTATDIPPGWWFVFQRGFRAAERFHGIITKEDK